MNTDSSKKKASDTSNSVSPTPLRLIVGLGNPGMEYEHTRHNVGFDALDMLASQMNLTWEKDRKSKALVARQGSEVVLLKPQTFMNLSGQSVARMTGFYKIPKEGILIVYDDVDTQIGKIKIKPKGSAGGHNGIKSIIECLGHSEFARLKIGIGTVGQGQLIGHVLGKFSEEEKPIVEKSLAQAVEGVVCALSDGLSSAMNHFNRREKPKNRTIRNSDQSAENET